MTDAPRRPAPRLELRPGLRLALTPGLRQSLSVLALPLSDLHDLIAAELAENPFLERSRPARHEGLTGGADWDHALQTAAQPVSVAEELHRQILLEARPGPARDLALVLAADLTPEGWLPAPPDRLAGELGADRDLVGQAVAILQSCQPTGIGATGLADCLALQAAELGEAGAVQDLVRHHLPLFARHRWPALARLSGLPVDEIRRIAALLPRLDPRPAARLEPAPTQAVIPEIGITPTPDGGLAVAPIRDGLPELTLDRDLAGRARQESAEAAAFVARHMERATALLRALSARERTLMRIGHALAARQAAFFLGDTRRLAPLTRRDLADDLGLHPSTVGRAVAGKYLSCRQGVFPLAAFFPRGLDTTLGRGSVSNQAIRQEIRRMIAAESPPGSLSDRQITARLRQTGVDISRRTVAKYRQCLKIPSSAQRRRSATAQ